MSNSLQKAVEAVKKATEEDEKGNYSAAIKQYSLSIDFFRHSIKYEQSDENIKAAIIAKCKEYLERAEHLKNYLDEMKDKDALASDTSGSRYDKFSMRSKANETDDDKRMKNQMLSAIVIEKPNIKWEDVAGLENAKQALQEAVILPIKCPHFFSGNRKPWKGILLFGPPGTGKSYLAKAVASQTENFTFISVSSSDLVCKWLGESEKLVRSLFEIAREKKPAIIFIDEIDSLCSARNENESESARRIKTEFLIQMDGVKSGIDNDQILVLGATNMPWVLDSGIKRRFERRIYIPLPDYLARVKLFQIQVGSTPNTLNNDDYHEFAKMTDGYSGDDIRVVVREALMEPIRRLQTSTHFRKMSGYSRTDPKTIVHDLYTPCPPSDSKGIEMRWMDIDCNKLLEPAVTARDVYKSLSNVRPTISKEEIEKLDQFCKEFGQQG